MSKPSERIGEVVGQRYELEAVIGQGGQGTVYRALDRWSERQVAVKILGAKATEPAVVERLMRELHALNVLQGTAAVQVLDTFRGNDGELCLVLELLVGEDLDQHLEARRGRERMRPERLVEILDPIVSTLEAAHAAGIIHRDLKPANIFLLERGGVRLLDFGMARLKKGTPLTAPGMVMGSPSFMAPEAWQGLSDLLDPRADVYSLAVIVFLALTGELPLSGQSLIEKFLGATQGKHRTLREFRSDLPQRADEWVARGLAMDRNQRFGSVGELWDSFFVAFRVKPPAHRRKSFWARAVGAMQRIAGSEAPSNTDPSTAAAWTNEGLPGYVLEPSGPPAPAAGSTPPVAAALKTTPPVAAPPVTAPAPGASARPRAPAKTIALEDADLLPVDAPVPPPPPPPRQLEKTANISVELIPKRAEPPARPPPTSKK